MRFGSREVVDKALGMNRHSQGVVCELD